MKPVYKALIVLICALVFYLGDTGRYFGPLVDRFVPCVQGADTSFPCFGVYDIGLMLAAGTVALIFSCWLLIDAIKILTKMIKKP